MLEYTKPNHSRGTQMTILLGSFIAKALIEACIAVGFSEKKFLDYIEHGQFEVAIRNCGLPFAQAKINGYQVTVILNTGGNMSASTMLKAKSKLEETLGKEYTVTLA